MRVFAARPLNADLFRPFETLLEPAGLPGIPVNGGRGRRIDLASTLAHNPAAATAALSIYELDASSWPVQPGEMEGIIYAQGIRHLPMVALHQPGRFAMMMWGNRFGG